MTAVPVELTTAQAPHRLQKTMEKEARGRRDPSAQQSGTKKQHATVQVKKRQRQELELGKSENPRERRVGCATADCDTWCLSD